MIFLFVIDEIDVLDTPAGESEVFVGEEGLRFGFDFSLFGVGGLPEKGKMQKRAAFHFNNKTDEYY